MKDAGLSNVAAGIKTRSDATSLAAQILKLSQGLERNQASLGKEQLRIIRDLLGKELQVGLKSVADKFSSELKKITDKILPDNETKQEFKKRRDNEIKEAIKVAIEAASKGIPAGVFKEAVEEVDKKLTTRLAQSEKIRNAQFRDTLATLKGLKVRLEGKAEVKVNADVKSKISESDQFSSAMKEAIPSMTPEQIKFLTDTVAVLSKVEKARGTKVPIDTSKGGRPPQTMNPGG